MGQPKLSHLILKRIFLECSFLLSFNGTLWDSKKSGKNLPMAHITEIEIGEVALARLEGNTRDMYSVIQGGTTLSSNPCFYL
ncbi:hypothetical protein GYH30_007573 [Glycine max]|nr:hypothetical protein GYH30_007573 [Glycine max]